jgi:hypothetical protein
VRAARCAARTVGEGRRPRQRASPAGHGFVRPGQCCASGLLFVPGPRSGLGRRPAWRASPADRVAALLHPCTCWRCVGAVPVESARSQSAPVPGTVRTAGRAVLGRAVRPVRFPDFRLAQRASPAAAAGFARRPRSGLAAPLHVLASCRRSACGVRPTPTGSRNRNDDLHGGSCSPGPRCASGSVSGSPGLRLAQRAWPPTGLAGAALRRQRARPARSGVTTEKASLFSDATSQNRLSPGRALLNRFISGLVMP